MRVLIDTNVLISAALLTLELIPVPTEEDMTETQIRDVNDEKHLPIAYSVLRSTPRSSMMSRLYSSKLAIKSALSSENIPAKQGVLLFDILCVRQLAPTLKTVFHSVHPKAFCSKGLAKRTPGRYTELTKQTKKKDVGAIFAPIWRRK